jgi:hypothetical protein
VRALYCRKYLSSNYPYLPVAVAARSKGTSLASESDWARGPMSQTGPCVECHEPDFGRFYVYIYVYIHIQGLSKRFERFKFGIFYL